MLVLGMLSRSIDVLKSISYTAHEPISNHLMTACGSELQPRPEGAVASRSLPIICHGIHCLWQLITIRHLPVRAIPPTRAAVRLFIWQVISITPSKKSLAHARYCTTPTIALHRRIFFISLSLWSDVRNLVYRDCSNSSAPFWDLSVSSSPPRFNPFGKPHMDMATHSTSQQLSRNALSVRPFHTRRLWGRVISMSVFRYLSLWAEISFRLPDRLCRCGKCGKACSSLSYVGGNVLPTLHLREGRGPHSTATKDTRVCTPPMGPSHMKDVANFEGAEGATMGGARAISLSSTTVAFIRRC